MEQFINGNETELRESMKTLTEMELYFERYVSPLSFNIITDAVMILMTLQLTRNVIDLLYYKMGNKP